jgi:hypothetical protein
MRVLPWAVSLLLAPNLSERNSGQQQGHHQTLRKRCGYRDATRRCHPSWSCPSVSPWSPTWWMVSEQSFFFFYFGFRKVLALTERVSYLAVRDDHILANPRLHVDNAVAVNKAPPNRLDHVQNRTYCLKIHISLLTWASCSPDTDGDLALRQ